LNHLGLGVHAFGPAVVKRQGDGGDRGVDVQVQAACEGVDVRQVAGPGGLGPVLEPGFVGGLWLEQGGEGADEAGEAGYLGAGGGGGPGEQLPDGHGGVGGAAGAQVITVGIHQCRPVLGGADHPLWFGGAGVALDGVQ
jgi:hypothetical protein